MELYRTSLKVVIKTMLLNLWFLLSSKNIIGKLNLELYKKYQAEVIITKNSGIIGGTDTKISAAISLNLPIIMIARPKIEYINKVNTFEAVLQLLNNKNGDEN